MKLDAERINYQEHIILVGLGPHAKRIYINILKELHIDPKIIIDLECKKEIVIKYLKDQNISCDLYFIEDKDKDRRRLSPSDKNNITSLLKKHKITKAIISTEPKSHLAYAELFLKLKIPVLMDKPLTAIKNVCFDDQLAQQLYKEYEYILNLSKKNNTGLVIQSQRRYHQGYLLIRKLLQETLLTYRIPITHIDIYHCDGQWNMPLEYITRDNHPFFCGYGKVLHSGYHFFDFLSWILTLNNLLPEKTPDRFSIIHKTTKPQDQLFQLSSSYQKLFGLEASSLSNEYFPKMGELDSYSILQFLRQDRVVTTSNINLLHNGFSRRSKYELSDDVYKGNGRVRHERINIQVGPILNIQVHSYQSYEIRDSCYSSKELEPGGLDHFDIFIFRNAQLIGGKPFQKIRMSNKNRVHAQTHLGHNEEARQQCTIDWLNGVTNENNIENHSLTNLIISSLYRCSAAESQGNLPFMEVEI